MNRTVLLAIVAIVSGCASSPPYDPQATETPATIVAKRVIDRVKRSTAEVQPAIPVPLARGIVLLEPARAGMGEISIYEYTVRTNDGRTVSVPSEYPAFEVGQCVTLFTSPRPTYPRIANGSGC